jgi:hypothetical protein
LMKEISKNAHLLNSGNIKTFIIGFILLKNSNKLKSDRKYRKYIFFKFIKYLEFKINSSFFQICKQIIIVLK